MKSVAQFISQITATQDRITAAEIAAALVTWAIETLGVPPETYEESPAKLLIWRGAAQYARDALKRVQQLLESPPDGEQPELFEGLREFVCIGDLASTFVRRHALTRSEYRAAQDHLMGQAVRLIKKIDRYENDFSLADPFWTPDMTFGEAYRLATEESTVIHAFHPGPSQPSLLAEE